MASRPAREFCSTRSDKYTLPHMLPTSMLKLAFLFIKGERRLLMNHPSRVRPHRTGGRRFTKRGLCDVTEQYLREMVRWVRNVGRYFNRFIWYMNLQRGHDTQKFHTRLRPRTFQPPITTPRDLNGIFWVQILAPQFPNCVISGKLFKLSRPQCLLPFKWSMEQRLWS